MIEQSQYVPILKGRLGEYGALQELASDTKSKIVPLIEPPPIPWDFAEDQPSKTIDVHLRDAGSRIERAWGAVSPALVDLLWIEETERMFDGTHPLAHVFRDGRQRGLQLIPVTGLGRDDAYQQTCRNVIHSDRRGVCLRLQREDFQETTQLPRDIEQLLDLLGIGPSDADLILDLRSLNGLEVSMLLAAVPAMVTVLPHLTEWRSFVIAGGAFPESLIGLPPLELSPVRRVEWQLWQNVVPRLHALRRPTFGDYGISHVQPSEVDPRIMRPSASIRYTAEDTWLVLKGRNLRDHGYGQFHTVCRFLVGLPDYSGADFSWGDGYVDDCANGNVGTGNLTTWRKVGTSHHLQFVINQLSNFVWP